MTGGLSARLRTPRGQLELLGATFVVALVLALVLASQRSFFERYVREKYPGPDAASERLAQRIEAGEVDAAALRALPPNGTLGLYHLWMQSDSNRYPNLPATAAAAHPELVAERVERTLVAGNREQRQKAIDFAVAARHDRLEPPLRFALDRARAARDAEAAEALSSALRRVQQPAAPR